MSTVVENLDELADELFRRSAYWKSKEPSGEANRHFFDGIAEGFRRAGVIVKSTTLRRDME